ncbi:hypothetical protein [Marinobacterium lutimaris]|uniref:Zinc-ribbon domain-containing protein n=1 Tax=Marinobacterium lutimaris TaxID=568106 RepID=A0A1H5TX77_9GAMM|nr:hypothetical protein [Marinobacterium lutimaris]SEF67369.1 hypothetical protein SAMN05444390_101196 [Marinobacterium lutimaris]
MALIRCMDCDHEISDQAASCVQCGRPIKAGADRSSPQPSSFHSTAWAAVTRSKTPINLFALAMMACAAVLGVSANSISNACSLIAFTYTLHTFLAVAGMFFVTLLFCRAGVYHPDDLAKAKRDGLQNLGRDKPLIAAGLIVLMFSAYALYQNSQGTPSCQAPAAAEEKIENQGRATSS